SSHIDRSVFINDSELNIESLIENLKNMIMKKLFMSCVTESFTFFSVSSVSFSAALSQSSTSVPVSDSPAPAISVPATLTSATPDFITSAFVISSPCFKKMLCRLNESHLSRITLSLNSVEIIIAPVLEVILIKDDNITETTLSHSQASLITSSFFSAGKVMHTLNHKYSALSDFCHLSDFMSLSFISSASVLSALTSGLAGSALFFNFST
ncbi:hypothetical protein BDDG_13394, partial [Blastomyces dermatitidis ATCC 18188]